MSELRRLRDIDGALGAAFRSADVDAPHPGAKTALVAALAGIGAASAAGTKAVVVAATTKAAGASMAPAAGAGATAKASVALLGTKWVVASAVILGGAAATTYAVREPAISPTVSTIATATMSAPPPQRRPSLTARTQPSSAPARSEAPAEDEALPVLAVTALPSAPPAFAPVLAARSVKASRAHVTTNASAARAVQAAPAEESASVRPPRATSAVSDEIAELDRARREVADGRGAEAVVTIERYRRRFPGGVMDEEARVLEIEALARAGWATRARELGAAFLRARPGSPLAPRVRRVVDDP